MLASGVQFNFLNSNLSMQIFANLHYTQNTAEADGN